MRELRVLAVVIQSIRIVRQRPIQVGSQLRTPVRRQDAFNEQKPISMKLLDPLGDLFGGLLDSGEREFFRHDCSTFAGTSLGEQSNATRQPAQDLLGTLT